MNIHDYLEAQRRFQERLAELSRQTEAVLAGLEEGSLATSEISRLDSLLAERRKLFEEYQEQSGSLVQNLRRLEQEQRRAEQANREAKMAEKRAKTPRSEEDIARLSEELTTKLRTDRIDDAIKELLAFLEDAEFYAANATTARKRRLRTLQKALETALN